MTDLEWETLGCTAKRIITSSRVRITATIKLRPRLLTTSTVLARVQKEGRGRIGKSHRRVQVSSVHDKIWWNWRLKLVNNICWLIIVVPDLGDVLPPLHDSHQQPPPHPHQMGLRLDTNYDSAGSTGGPCSGGGGGGQTRTKRMRTSFKHHQLRTMKSYFAINQNPDAKDLKQLAQKTGLSKRVLQVRWIMEREERAYVFINLCFLYTWRGEMRFDGTGPSRFEDRGLDKAKRRGEQGEDRSK